MLLFSCENDIEKIKVITTKTNTPSESAQDAILIYSDSSRVKVKLNATKIDRYLGTNAYLELPEGVEVIFYNDKMQIQSRLTADYAIRFEKQGKMEAKGNVVLVNEIGETLNTEHLFWNENTGKIYSYEFVKITTANEIIMGDGFESNQNFTKFKITKIKGTINIEN
jgi:LPS export ABC transporter protein LptC